MILYFLPATWHQKASTIIIVSDPLLIGLVFMGALVLFEKSERVLDTLAVSPVKIYQYVMSKSISIVVIGLISSLVIALSGSQIESIPTFIVGITLGSLLFSFTGLAVSARVKTLNEFLIKIVPAMILGTFPLILYAADMWHWSLDLHPCSAIINLINNAEGKIITSIGILLTWSVVMFFVANRMVGNMIKNSYIAKL